MISQLIAIGVEAIKLRGYVANLNDLIPNGYKRLFI